MSENWVYNAIYYDDYSRIVQTVSQIENKTIEYVSNIYSFSGQIELSKTLFINEYTSDKYYIINGYEYDNRERLKYKSQSLDDGNSWIILEEYEYDLMGQIIEKNVYSQSDDNSDYAQSVDYKYNINGLLTDINAIKELSETNRERDLFALKLHYELDEIGNTIQKNGNISAMQWNSALSPEVKSYNFEYDQLNRLRYAIYLDHEKYSEYLSYDLNGNILNLRRSGEMYDREYSAFGQALRTDFGIIDDLEYEYSGNMIKTIDDMHDTDTPLNHDFKDNGFVSSHQAEYYYDANGNMIIDRNKGIKVEYNFLNLPKKITFDDKSTLEYTYTASGQKLKTIYNGDYTGAAARYHTTCYYGAFIYEDDKLSSINIEGGRIMNIEENFDYQFYLTDHLGNVRIMYDKNGEVLQEDHYYAFGLTMGGQSYTHDMLTKFQAKNEYLYNGKEFQSEGGLDLYDYGARFYDPVIARWSTVDPLAESYYSWSPYCYVMNNPLKYIDPTGMWVDNYIVGEDGVLKTIEDTGDDNHKLFIEDSNGNRNQVSFHDTENDSKNLSLAQPGDKILYSLSSSNINWMTDNSDVEPMAFSERKEFTENESTSGKLDYAQEYFWEAFDIGSYTEAENSPISILLPGNSEGFNIHDAGNFIWGHSMNILGFSETTSQAGAHWNNLRNNGEFDSSGDQDAIKKGYETPIPAVTPVMPDIFKDVKFDWK